MKKSVRSAVVALVCTVAAAIALSSMASVAVKPATTTHVQADTPVSSSAPSPDDLGWG